MWSAKKISDHTETLKSVFCLIQNIFGYNLAFRSQLLPFWWKYLHFLRRVPYVERTLCSLLKIVLIWPNRRATTPSYLTYPDMHKAFACFGLHWFFKLSNNHKISLKSHTLCDACSVTEPGKIQKCSLGQKSLSVSIILEIFQPSCHFLAVVLSH